MKSIILFGSARSDGHTKSAINVLDPNQKIPLIDLADYDITDFDYEHKNQNDDFLPLIKRILEYDHLVFATPVYWYYPSGLMKRFLDRFSDLLTIQKTIGRRLRGKHFSVIASYGLHPEGINGFEETMRDIAGYLGMNFQQCVYYYSGELPNIRESNILELKCFSEWL